MKEEVHHHIAEKTRVLSANALKAISLLFVGVIWNGLKATKQMNNLFFPFSKKAFILIKSHVC